jgi:hypothetical protein
MAVRTARTSEKSRNRWGQIGISACVLLLPPIAIGAAATAMLASRQDIAARDAAPAAQSIAIAVAAETVPAFERDAALAQPPLPEPVGPQPALPPPAAGKHAATPAPGGAGTYSLASAGQELAPQTPQAPQAGKDMARLMGPVPVRVTVVVAPNAGHPDGTQTDPPAGETAPPPPPSTPAGSPPVPPAMPAGSPPVPPAMLAELPPVPPERPAGFAADVSAEARTARSSRLPSRTPIIRQPPHRNPVHDAARAARPQPKPTDPLSALRSWLQQLGSPPRAAQRG